MTDPDRDTGFAKKDEWMAKFSYVVDPRAEVRNRIPPQTGLLRRGLERDLHGFVAEGLRQESLRSLRRYGGRSDEEPSHQHRADPSGGLQAQDDVDQRLPTATTSSACGTAWTPSRAPTSSTCSTIGRLSLLEARTLARKNYLRVLRGQTTFADIGKPDGRIVSANNARDFVSEGVQSNFRWDFETGRVSHRFEAGLRLHYDRIERRRTAERSELYGGEPYPDRTPTVDHHVQQGRHLRAMAPHVQYRADHRQPHGDLRPSMRARS